VDLYRLDSARDAATLGLDDLFDSPALVMIEWGERFPELMPPGHIEIRLRPLEGDAREIELCT
jgi:tRNA threonylcarbamoyladenosine biosynthesis protein TsaE